LHVTPSTVVDMLIQKATEAVGQAKREGGNQVYTIFV